MSINVKPRWAKLLTLGQIIQMVFGILINAWFFVKVYIFEEYCSGDRPDLLAVSCAIMYGSYLFLFLQFYFKRYSYEEKKEK
jgi:elongation of very long chain fatty acids protein 6